MALGWRTTMYFSSSINGWSEAWHNISAGSGGRAQAEQDAKDLVDARGAICGLGIFIRGVRISFQDSPRPVSVLVDLSNTGLGITTPILVDPTTGYAGNSAARSADIITTSLVVRCRNTDGRKKLFWMAGIPDDIIRTNPDGPTITNAALWLQRYDTWKQLIMGGKWGFRARVPAGVAAPQFAGVGLDRRTTGLGLIGVIVDGAQVFQPGQRVQLRGYRPYNSALPKLNGVYQIDTVATLAGNTQTVYYLRGTEGFDPDVYTIQGTIQLVAYEAIGVNEVQILRQGSHRRGRPFGQLRGRSSTPKRLIV